MPLDPRGVGHVAVETPLDDPDLCRLLAVLGFDPETPIYRATPVVSFRALFAEIERSLCGSERSGPPHEAVRFHWCARDRRHGGSAVDVLVELLQAVPQPFRWTQGGPLLAKPIDEGLYPSDVDWYIRGMVDKSFNEAPDQRLHAYVQTSSDPGGPDWPHGMIVQIVDERSCQPQVPGFVWGTGVPGRRRQPSIPA